MTSGRAVTALQGNRDFRLLWLGQAASEIGTSITQVALPLLVLAVTGSPRDTGLVWFSLGAAGLITRLFAGTLVDRRSRRSIMLSCDAGRAIALGSIVMADIAGHVTLAQLVLVGVVVGCLDSVFGPSEAAAVMTIVPAEQVPTAVAVCRARAQAASLIGGPAGGLFYSLGRVVPFAVDLASYILSFACLWRIRSIDLRRPISTSRPLDLQELTAGYRFIWSNAFLRTSAVTSVVLNFASSGLLLAVVLIARQAGASSTEVGLITGMGALGGLVAATAVPYLLRLPPPGLVIGGWSLFFVFSALMATTTRPLALGILFAASLAAAAPAVTVMDSKRLLLTPTELQGRTQSAIYFLGGIAQPLGPLAAGLMLESADAPGEPLLVFAGSIGIAAVLCVLTKSVRQLTLPGSHVETSSTSL